MMNTSQFIAKGSARFLAVVLSLFAVLNSEYVAAHESALPVLQPKPVVRFKGVLDTGGAELLVFSPASKLIAIGNRDYTVQVWDASSGKKLSTIAVTKEIPDMHWSPEGERLLITNRRKSADVWNVRTAEKVCSLIGLERDMYEAKWSPDGKAILLTTFYNTWKADFLAKKRTDAHLWDAETGRLKFTLKIPGLYGKVAFSTDGQQILTGADKDDAALWNASTGKLVATLNSFRRSVLDSGASGVFSPDGRFVAVYTYGRGIYLWETATGKLVKTLAVCESRNDYWLLGFSPDGKLLAIYREERIGSWFKLESSIELRDSLTGELRVSLTGKNMRYCAHQFEWSPDGKTLVTGGGSKKYEGKIWDVATGKLHATFPMVAKIGRVPFTSYFGDIDSLSFHPTVPILIAESNNFIRFWNPQTGELIQTLESTGFRSHWSADGRLLVRLSKDQKSVQIWEPAT